MFNKNEYQRKLKALVREEQKSKGLCLWAHCPLAPAKNKLFCLGHAKRRAASRAEQVRKQKERGLCQWSLCSNKALIGETHCPSHKEKRRKGNLENRHQTEKEQKAKGLCAVWHCSEKALKDRKSCLKHSISRLKARVWEELKNTASFMSSEDLSKIKDVSGLFKEIRLGVEKDLIRAEEVTRGFGWPDSKEYNTEIKIGFDWIRSHQIIRSFLQERLGVDYKILWARDIGDLYFNPSQCRLFKNTEEFITAQRDGTIFN